jgi:hypothetical protein
MMTKAGHSHHEQETLTHLKHSGELLEFVEVDSFVFFILSYQNIRLACITIQTHVTIPRAANPFSSSKH